MASAAWPSHPKIQILSDIPEPWNDPYLPAEIARKLLAQPHHLLLTFQHSYLLARLIPHTTAEILTLHTPPESRRQGHAKALLHNLITRARQAACPSIILEVRTSNHPAIALYESLNFTRQTVRKNYYTNPVEDGAVFTLIL